MVNESKTVQDSTLRIDEKMFTSRDFGKYVISKQCE